MDDPSAPSAPGDDITWGLDEAIRALRADLRAAAADRSGIQFPVESATFDLTIVAVRDRRGKVAFRVPVVGADGELGGRHEVHSRLTIVLGAPVNTEDGSQVKVHDTSDVPKR